MLMIDNMSTFASYRMDTILVPFIGVLWESHATTVALAQEALLRWTEWHHFHLLDKETRTIIDKTLEVTLIRITSILINSAVEFPKEIINLPVRRWCSTKEFQHLKL